MTPDKVLSTASPFLVAQQMIRYRQHNEEWRIDEHDERINHRIAASVPQEQLKGVKDDEDDAEDQQRVEERAPPTEVLLEARASAYQGEIAERHDVNRAVDEAEEQRVAGGRVAHDPPDADWEGDVVEQEIVCDPVVALSQEENEDFREEREVVEEIPPHELHGLVASGRVVERLTAAKRINITEFGLHS
jgi:hypothetical protein